MKAKHADEAVVTIRLDAETAAAFAEYMRKVDAWKKADAARTLMRQSLRSQGLLPEIPAVQRRVGGGGA